MKSNIYIPALTGVRAIAAFLVFFHHFNRTDFSYPVFRTLNEFHMGVTLFFVLSGFLICLRYYDTCEINGTRFRKY
ncbi:acyltransferase family protein, partial [Streptococcus suis]